MITLPVQKIATAAAFAILAAIATATKHSADEAVPSAATAVRSILVP